MLTSLGLILLFGLLFANLFQRLRLPPIIGMLVAGVFIGPVAFNLLDSQTLAVSADLRRIALIVILLKAGLTLNLSDLKKVGRPAILLAFLPASFELLAYYLFAPILLGINQIEALLMGAVLAAVSPAVVVPRMVHMIENGIGTEKQIPQIILAGASCDDIFVLVLFSTFTSMAQGHAVSVFSFLQIPISIFLGLAIGALLGLVLAKVWKWLTKRQKHMTGTYKVILLLALSFMLMGIENSLQGHVPFSGLLAVVSMAAALKLKSPQGLIANLSDQMGKVWQAAEIVLFVLVGAAVDVRYTLEAGLMAVILIFGALLIRTFGVILSLQGTSLTVKEKLFCVIAYLPKATVQAAIGSVPLSLGLESGPIILAVAVLGILITAPLGAIGIDYSYKKLL
ncbi:cation:proton antiporter [Streptococcus moroccensis]|uniref:NhaP-type Na+/H+ or K+/H+ antiporter n=1 Tax=Streptococcus moroccensis TaxID=1451356 RepID=A0ABT9YRJ8_9STRE|nr:cation:proton antiporter [Streptococcus moroccensis]MDQ0221735.1 NhaP-type Na+/H+ or K+/H+ antiporter [Streptococcus moroccensis]